MVDSALPSLEGKVRWLDREQEGHRLSLDFAAGAAPEQRDVDLAVRAARLWHARIVARALELNERGEHRRAESWVGRSRREFRRYVAGLPGVGDLVESLDRLVDRVGREWRTVSHRESYVMARKVMMGKPELREEAPASYLAAFELDPDDRGTRGP
jgi:hypothetical protein